MVFNTRAVSEKENNAYVGLGEMKNEGGMWCSVLDVAAHGSVGWKGTEENCL